MPGASAKSSLAPTTSLMPVSPRGRMGADHAGQRVAVGHRDRMEAERGSRPHQLAGMRGAAEEGEVGRHLEFGIGRGHANSPWRNQAGGAPGRYSPSR